MAEPVQSDHISAAVQRSTPRRVLGWTVGVLLGLLVSLLLLRVFIRPIAAEQEAPERHVGGPCWLCHLVTDKAEILEVDAQ